MTHTDAGHYAAKHPGKNLDEKIAQRVKSAVAENKIACAEAFKIAVELNVRPADVGLTVDLLEVRIKKCQLGLFGYGDKKKAVMPADKVSTDIRQAIEKSAVNGRLPCKSAWEISEKLGLPKMEISSACEAMKIKIISCQLGAFK